MEAEPARPRPALRIGGQRHAFSVVSTRETCSVRFAGISNAHGLLTATGRVGEHLVVQSDGLTLSRRELRSGATVGFEPTLGSPTLGDALLHLDQNIQRLRDRSPSPVPDDGRPNGAPPAPIREEIGIFEGLNAEILQRRTGGDSGRAEG